MAPIKPCDCEKASPNTLGVFCKLCGGFIEDNKQFIARDKPQFKDKPWTKDHIIGKFKHAEDLKDNELFDNVVHKLTLGANVYDVLDDLLLTLKNYSDI